VELLSAVAVNWVTPEGDDLSIALSSGQQLTSPVVIVATGATYRRLNVPGEEDLIGAGVHFCATCDGPLYRGAEELIVIGGGNSALEEGLHLSEFAKRIRVLARSGLSASSILQDRVRSDPQFVIDTDLDIEALEEENGRFSAVLIRDRATGECRRLPAAAAFVFVGLRPINGFLDVTVARDEGGFLVTSPSMETTMTGVFAAGDARSGSTKQLGSAVGEGIAALLMARRALESRRLKSVALVDV
jgi:thioredoxin reductase (NADPH)